MLTKGELIWGPMMRMSGPPLYSELDLLIMATRKRCANAAVDSLLHAHTVIRNYSPGYEVPLMSPITWPAMPQDTVES